VTPGALERVLRLINSLYPYFQTIKTLMTILTPSKSATPHGFTSIVLMLLWYAKNFRRITDSEVPGTTESKLGLLKELRNDSIFYLTSSIDINSYENLILRLAQLIFSCFSV
jgi:hypothetical protein